MARQSMQTLRSCSSELLVITSFTLRPEVSEVIKAMVCCNTGHFKAATCSVLDKNIISLEIPHLTNHPIGQNSFYTRWHWNLLGAAVVRQSTLFSI